MKDPHLKNAGHKPGDVIAGRYVLIEEIGRGGFGVVYRAIQKGVERHVALKMLQLGGTHRAGFDPVEAFRSEALHTSKLSHPNTITLFDFGETDDGGLFLVTELLHGDSLRQRLSRERTMTPMETLRIGRQIAKSLAEAHTLGIVHGDLKPENVFLIDLHGERNFVKLLDFGIARLAGEAQEGLMGTPEYMSPEHFVGQPLLPGSDVYSVGLMLFEMLLGHSPFGRRRSKSLFRCHVFEPIPPMPDKIERSELGRIVRKATAKAPDDRYSDGLALFEALEGVTSRFNTDELVRHINGEPIESSSQSMVALGRSEVPGSAQNVEAIHSTDAHAKPVRDTLERLPTFQSVLPFVGRRSDRRFFRDLAVTVRRERRGRVVVLGGAAGVGKTRLARWFVRESDLPGEDALGGSGSCDKGGIVQALGEALCEALVRHMPKGERLPIDELLHRLPPAMGRALRDDEVDAIKLLARRNPGESINKGIGVWPELIAQLASQSLLVLHLDNIHLGGEMARGLLSDLAWLCQHRRAELLVVCTVRREALSEGPFGEWLLALNKTHRCIVPRPLDALSYEETETLARLFLRTALGPDHAHLEISPRLISLIARRSCGNARYIESLTRTLCEHRLLVRTVEGIELAPGAEIEVTIPEEMIESVYEPLKRFCKARDETDDIERVLQGCAVLGTPLSRGLLLRFFVPEGIDTELLDGYLLELQEADLIRAEDGLGAYVHYRFVQPLLAQVLEHQLDLVGETGELHRRAANIKHAHYSLKGTLQSHMEDIDAHRRRAQLADGFKMPGAGAIRPTVGTPTGGRSD